MKYVFPFIYEKNMYFPMNDVQICGAFWLPLMSENVRILSSPPKWWSTDFFHTFFLIGTPESPWRPPPLKFGDHIWAVSYNHQSISLLPWEFLRPFVVKEGMEGQFCCCSFCSKVLNSIMQICIKICWHQHFKIPLHTAPR